MINKFGPEIMDEAAKALVVQNHIRHSTEQQVSQISNGINYLAETNDRNLSDLDRLFEQAQYLCDKKDLSIDSIGPDEINKYAKVTESKIALSSEEKVSIKTPRFNLLEVIKCDDQVGWNEYVSRVEQYAEINQIYFSKDPFDTLMSNAQRAQLIEQMRADYTLEKSNCDKYDYIIASFCGLLAGIIDSFFVGMPEDSKLGNWTDKKTDEFVIMVAKKIGWKPRPGNENSIKHAIDYLEAHFNVNYEQTSSKSVNNLIGLTTINHHIKSLGHSPDIIGLLFSIIDQFCSTSHFLDNGRLIIIDTEKFELRGNNFVIKILCGFTNWLGHLISDIAGSTSSRGGTSRGTGIPIPFFELFQMCDFGEFKVYNKQKTNSSEKSLADLAVEIFESGYDARFGMAQSIPVLINEMMIRIIWAIKNKFYNGKSWSESIPIGSKPELRRMLLTGHGVLCLVDGIDAALRSNGEILSFALHLNFEAWKRLAFSGLLEVRAIYKENILDIASLDYDLEFEWNRLKEVGYEI